MARKPVVNAAADKARNSYVWKMHGGSHMYCATYSVGCVDSVLGVVAPADNDQYVGCILNQMSSYKLYDSLNGAMVVIESLIALEA